MSEQEKKENQKTIVAFAAGLLIGGLLVWVFGGSPKTEVVDETNSTETEQTETSVPVGTTSEEDEASAEIETAVPTLQTGDGEVSVSNQAAGTTVSLESATFPSDEGWVGVRDYVNGQLGYILGVARYSKEQGLVPEEITLQRATKAGNSYAIVFYRESGDRVFSLADDVQIGDAFATFTATAK